MLRRGRVLRGGGFFGGGEFFVEEGASSRRDLDAGGIWTREGSGRGRDPWLWSFARVGKGLGGWRRENGSSRDGEEQRGRPPPVRGLGVLDVSIGG
jgi:hypothetical protein